LGTIPYIFISGAEILQQNWLEAFPDAVCMRLENAKLEAAENTVIWLRLSSDATVAQQIATVRQTFPSQALVVLSDIPSDLEALAVLSCSARAYCNTHAGKEVLSKVAAVVEQGGLWIGESIMQRLLAPTDSRSPLTVLAGHAWATNLTEREIEVAKAIALGGSNKEIAAQLEITERTVKAHIGAIFEKLKVRDRLQLALLVKNS
jgi:two-component system nitrate/nitrite response regulator NarL